jgi:hypothetical protein
VLIVGGKNDKISPADGVDGRLWPPGTMLYHPAPHFEARSKPQPARS